MHSPGNVTWGFQIAVLGISQYWLNVIVGIFPNMVMYVCVYIYMYIYIYVCIYKSLYYLYTVKAMIFPLVMHGCESGTIKKAEHQRIDTF